MQADTTSPKASVHQPLLRGLQWISALWLPSDWLTDRQRAQRILRHWRPGASALRFAQGDLLRWAAPVQWLCDGGDGWPLTLQSGVLCSASLTAAEAAAAPPADAWLVRGGTVLPLHFGDGVPLNPAQWLDIDAVALHDTYDCTTALPEAVVLAPSEARDLREILNGKVPPPTQAQREFAQALAQRSERLKAAITPGYNNALGTSRGGSAWVPVLSGILVAGGLLLADELVSRALNSDIGLWSVLLPLLGGWLVYWATRGALQRSIRTVRPRAQAATAKASTGGNSLSDLPARGLARFAPQAWRQWLARLAVASQVSKLLGRRQGAYVRKMLELFESGDLEAALRHAIPLGGQGESSLGQAFGTPSARQNLSLSARRGPSININLGEHLDAHLRKLYRKSFERLDREGKIDEAVFVLAELLEARQEALDYLERHERFAQAAELALAWDQAPAVIVRLHCLAGDWRRAVAVARRDKAFAAAVLQLEAKWPDPAARLREEWAEALATQGDWLGAVDAIWPLSGKRDRARNWLLSAEAADGELGAAALVKRAILLPETLDDCADRLTALRDEPGLHTQRGAMARALLAQTKPPEPAKQLARLLAGASLADHAQGSGKLTRSELQGLLTLGGDALLAADLPNGKLPHLEAKPLSAQTKPLVGELPEAGAVPILDAVPLEDGRYLLALGEAGVAIASAQGKIVTRFAAPAERLVIAHNCRVALALAPREAVWRVSRLDLTHRHVTDLGVAEFGPMAREFDGIAWTVIQGNKLRVLDTQHSLSEVLWQVTDLPGQAVGLSVSPELEQIVLATPPEGELELWRYQLPMRRLIARGEPLPAAPPPGALRVAHPNGGVVDVWLAQHTDGHWELHRRIRGCTFSMLAAGASDTPVGLRAYMAGDWLLVGFDDDEDLRWQLLPLSQTKVTAHIDWPSGANCQGRLVQQQALVFDTQGRLWHLDTTTSEMRSLSIHSR